MRVFVAGGTGFVGPAVVRGLLAEEHEVTLLVNRSAGPFDPPPPGVRLVRGDVTALDSFAPAVPGHDAYIHLVAILRADPRRGVTFERMHTLAARNSLEAARVAGMRRFLYMSAIGVRADGTPYQRTKWESEQAVKASGLDWTIFRPTFITGPAEPGSPGFDDTFAALTRRSPFLPSFAGGGFKIQPIARRDVALAFAHALAEPNAIGKTYELAGPEAVTWNDYLRTLAALLDKRRALVPVPRAVILVLASAFGRFRWFPSTRDQLVMLFEGAVADPTPAVEDLGLTLTPWREALREAIVDSPRSKGRARRNG